MDPISSSLGWISRKPNTPSVATGASSFAAQLQSTLQTNQAAAQSVVPDGPSRATVGHLHPGGMNDAALRLKAMASK